MLPFQFPIYTTTFFTKTWVFYALLFTTFSLLSSFLRFKLSLAASHITKKIVGCPIVHRAMTFCPPIFKSTFIKPLWVFAQITFRSWRALTLVGVSDSLWSTSTTIRALFNFSFFEQSLALCGWPNFSIVPKYLIPICSSFGQEILEK